MFINDNSSDNASDVLLEKGYWLARADRFLNEKKYSKTVEICKRFMDESSESISAWLIYGKALYYTGQLETAADNFYKVLTSEPDNVVALKLLADIDFKNKNYLTAEMTYNKILSIDPASSILKSEIDLDRENQNRIITLKRSDETVSEIKSEPLSRDIPFYTETMGDLYLSQGFPNLAYEVYRKINNKERSSRLEQKLKSAEEKIREKDKYVKKTD